MYGQTRSKHGLGVPALIQPQGRPAKHLAVVGGVLLLAACMQACRRDPAPGEQPASGTPPVPAPAKELPAEQPGEQPARQPAAQPGEQTLERLAKLAESTDMTLPGTVVRRGRYVTTQNDIEGGDAIVATEDFVFTRTDTGYLGKAHAQVLSAPVQPSLVVFALDSQLRLQNAIWKRLEGEPLAYHFTVQGQQLAIAPHAQGAAHARPNRNIDLEQHWTLDIAELLHCARFGSAALPMNEARTWQRIRVDPMTGDLGVDKTAPLTRGKDQPFELSDRTRVQARHYTAETSDSDATTRVALWTDEHGCLLQSSEDTRPKDGSLPTLWKVTLEPAK